MRKECGISFAPEEKKACFVLLVVTNGKIELLKYYLTASRKGVDAKVFRNLRQ